MIFNILNLKYFNKHLRFTIKLQSSVNFITEIIVILYPNYLTIKTEIDNNFNTKTPEFVLT